MMPRTQKSLNPGRLKDKHENNLQPAVPSEAAGLIVREHVPENLEFPFPSLNTVLTANESFYVRSHFSNPEIDLKKWRLEIGGEVERPFQLSYDELIKLPSATVTALMECAGNGRIFIPSKQEGVQWGPGAVGAAEWTGVWLRDLLDRAGVCDGAREIVLEGADCGALDKEPKTPGKIHYSHSVPIEKARQNVLLAYKMNGENLSASHGFPLRAVVPGWYGMAAVKWLTRITVTRETFTGYFQTADYSYWANENGLPPQMKPVTEIEVRAQIARPAMHEVVPADSTYVIRGAAWSGEAKIKTVELSVDAGKIWKPVKLKTEPVQYLWTLWEYEWHTPKTSEGCTLMVRATDESGKTHPTKHDDARGGYMANFIVPVPVKIRSG